MNTTSPSRLIGSTNDTMNNKSILAIITIFVLGMFGYNIFFVQEEVASGLDDISTSSIGTDVLNLRNGLQAVTLDRAIFSDDGFLELSDFSTAIPEQSIGRSNPFDIIGS